MTFNRIYQFSAAHRLHSRAITDSANIKVYDKCNNPNGHGHDYRLEVSLAGTPDDQTGMIISMSDFDNNVHKILDQLDFKHLDREVPFFKKNLSTGEIIIRFLWRELNRVLPAGRLFHLKLWETNNNYFELGNIDF
jgi:6-pyruvoyltetrahydropterin/6-carboxytetrahydropterin synthase